MERDTNTEPNFNIFLSHALLVDDDFQKFKFVIDGITSGNPAEWEAVDDNYKAKICLWFVLYDKQHQDFVVN